ncbi:hypothetical protein [Enterococcus sp. LJL90]
MFKKWKSNNDEGPKTEALLRTIIEAGYEVRISQDLSDNFKDKVWVVDIEPYEKEKSDPSFRGLLSASLNDVLIEAIEWLA